MNHIKCAACKNPLPWRKLGPITFIAPCQTCLDAARKAAGDDAYVKGYDKGRLDEAADDTPEGKTRKETMTREVVIQALMNFIQS